MFSLLYFHFYVFTFIFSLLYFHFYIFTFIFLLSLYYVSAQLFTFIQQGICDMSNMITSYRDIVFTARNACYILNACLNKEHYRAHINN